MNLEFENSQEGRVLVPKKTLPGNIWMYNHYIGILQGLGAHGRGGSMLDEAPVNDGTQPEDYRGEVKASKPISCRQLWSPLV